MIERHSESESLIKEQQVIFDSSGEAIGFLRPHYLVKCNRQWAELLGYGIDELVGKPAWMWHPSYDEWRDLALTCQQTFFKGEIYRCATQLRRKNGELFWAELSGKAVDPHNPERGSVWIGSDITERRHTESSLRRSEQRFRNLVSLSSDWYWEQDRNGRFTLLSGRLFDDIGLNQAYIEGKTFREIAVPNYTTEEHWNELNTLINDQRPFWNFSFPVRTPSGDLRWFSVSGNPAFDEQGDFDGYHGVGTDITSQVENAERYRHLAHHDTLTGLPNRRLLSDRLERATARAKRDGQRVILMLLDLDEFKAINDTLGHSIGDEVLIVVSQRLKMAIRESDTVARLGGDEFVILLPDARHPHDGNTVAEKVLEVLKEPLLAGGQHHNVRVSIGIAVFPDHAEDCERLFQQADIAMYRTKRKGGGVFLLGDNYKIITGGQSAA